MATQAKLSGDIAVEGGALRVGANPQPPNKLTLTITNQGDAVRYTPANPLFLSVMLGSGKEAVFFDDKDARNCEKEIPRDWTVDWDFSRSSLGKLKIYSSRKSLGKSESLTIVLGKIISKTDPEGFARVSLESAPDVKQDFDIKKTADKPTIIYFSSEPEAGVQNLPGDSVTLKWRTYKLSNRELTQVGYADPLSTDFRKDEGTHTILDVSTDMTFRLKGYDAAKPIDRELSVKVLRAGWYERKNTLLEGDPGYPSPTNEAEVHALQRMGKQCSLEPTLLLNANNQCVYAVFRHIFQGTERAFLFQTKNPFGPWQLVETSVSNQPASIRIPDGFSTSPGVYFDEKLWLIGGSQIDPNIVSNHVWCCDPRERVWKNWGVAKWPPRMGHAVLEFQNKIWVMGGRDAAGNACNDVWTLDDPSKNQWTPLGQASWTPRCLFNPAVFEDQIWLYGGASEPSSADLFDDLYVCTSRDNTKPHWEKNTITEALKGKDRKKPIASCLQVFDKRLHLFGKFRATATEDGSRLDEPFGFCLSDPSTGTWERFPSDGLGTWGTHTTFSYQAVNFSDRMLIAKALPARTKEANPILKIYIPGSKNLI